MNRFRAEGKEGVVLAILYSVNEKNETQQAAYIRSNKSKIHTQAGGRRIICVCLFVRIDLFFFLVTHIRLVRRAAQRSTITVYYTKVILTL